MYNKGNCFMSINKIIPIINIPAMQSIVNKFQSLINIYNDTLYKEYVASEYQWENKVNKMQAHGYSQKRIQWVRQHRINRINCKIFNSYKGQFQDVIEMFLSQDLVQMVRDFPLTQIDITNTDCIVR